jgi:hypothetical protein
VSIPELVRWGILSLHAVLIWWITTQAFPYDMTYWIVTPPAALGLTFYAVQAVKATNDSPQYPSAVRARQGR